MCAITAGQRGRRVIVLERASKVGKKILISGGGRCNFTNLHIEPRRYLSHNPHFCKSALSRYTQWDFIALLEKHGVAYHEKTLGQLFCDDTAKDIVKMLLDECERGDVKILTDCEITKLECLSQRYGLHTSKGQFTADSLVVASGGLSIPKMGSSGFGFDLAKRFGLNVYPTQAALVPFTMTDAYKDLCKRLSGISVPVIVSVEQQSFRENMLFTHRGLSGPAMLQISSYWRLGSELKINLLPDHDASLLLKQYKKMHPKAILRTLLTQTLPKKLVLELEQLLWLKDTEKPLGDWPDKQLIEVGSTLNVWTLKPSGTEGYRTAEVTLGGVDTRQISSKTMESQTQPGLYFIGEVLDVTGHLGGFNFQWAWSSGSAAGQYV
ncbi:MAG: aminoacetone oxidase family FAD-binding enzyme [Thiothrix sp.]|nr:MAG: aminoacetone oxidase family FAD-binding enzyme [Thiothrix sp.]